MYVKLIKTAIRIHELDFAKALADQYLFTKELSELQTFAEKLLLGFDYAGKQEQFIRHFLHAYRKAAFRNALVKISDNREHNPSFLASTSSTPSLDSMSSSSCSLSCEACKTSDDRAVKCLQTLAHSLLLQHRTNLLRSNGGLEDAEWVRANRRHCRCLSPCACTTYSSCLNMVRKTEQEKTDDDETADPGSDAEEQYVVKAASSKDTAFVSHSTLTVLYELVPSTVAECGALQIPQHPAPSFIFSGQFQFLHEKGLMDVRDTPLFLWRTWINSLLLHQDILDPEAKADAQFAKKYQEDKRDLVAIGQAGVVIAAPAPAPAPADGAVEADLVAPESKDGSIGVTTAHGSPGLLTPLRLSRSPTSAAANLVDTESILELLLRRSRDLSTAHAADTDGCPDSHDNDDNDDSDSGNEHDNDAESRYRSKRCHYLFNAVAALEKKEMEDTDKGEDEDKDEDEDEDETDEVARGAGRAGKTLLIAPQTMAWVRSRRMVKWLAAEFLTFPSLIPPVPLLKRLLYFGMVNEYHAVLERLVPDTHPTVLGDDGVCTPPVSKEICEKRCTFVTVKNSGECGPKSWKVFQYLVLSLRYIKLKISPFSFGPLANPRAIRMYLAYEPVRRVKEETEHDTAVKERLLGKAKKKAEDYDFDARWSNKCGGYNGGYYDGCLTGYETGYAAGLRAGMRTCARKNHPPREVKRKREEEEDGDDGDDGDDEYEDSAERNKKVATSTSTSVLSFSPALETRYLLLRETLDQKDKIALRRDVRVLEWAIQTGLIDPVYHDMSFLWDMEEKDRKNVLAPSWTLMLEKLTPTLVNKKMAGGKRAADMVAIGQSFALSAQIANAPWIDFDRPESYEDCIGNVVNMYQLPLLYVWMQHVKRDFESKLSVFLSTKSQETCNETIEKVTEEVRNSSITSSSSTSSTSSSVSSSASPANVVLPFFGLNKELCLRLQELISIANLTLLTACLGSFSETAVEVLEECFLLNEFLCVGSAQAHLRRLLVIAEVMQSETLMCKVVKRMEEASGTLTQAEAEHIVHDFFGLSHGPFTYSAPPFASLGTFFPQPPRDKHKHGYREPQAEEALAMYFAAHRNHLTSKKGWRRCFWGASTFVRVSASPHAAATLAKIYFELPTTTEGPYEDNKEGLLQYSLCKGAGLLNLVETVGIGCSQGKE